jgi:hypothetical protein
MVRETSAFLKWVLCNAIDQGCKMRLAQLACLEASVWTWHFGKTFELFGSYDTIQRHVNSCWSFVRYQPVSPHLKDLKTMQALTQSDVTLIRA